MIQDLHFYLLAIPIVFIVGASKGGFGGGLGMIAVPMLSLFIDPRLAAAILLPILITMDGVSLWKFKDEWHFTNIKILMPGALCGTVLGAISFELTNADFVRLSIGVMALLFSFYFIYTEFIAVKTIKNLKKMNTQNKKNLGFKGTFWGSVAGFTSYIAHAGGPPITMFLLPQKLSKAQFVSTTILFFSIINVIKLIPYTVLGQINSASFSTSLVLLPIAPLGVLAGVYLHKKISETLFYKITCVLLFLAGLKLCYEGMG